MSEGEYTTAQVAQLAGLTSARVRRFVTLGLLQPRRGTRGEHRFGFGDVALLRAWAKLPNASPARIRRALDAGGGQDDVSLGAEGGAIVVKDARGSWDPNSGQRLLEFEDGGAVTSLGSSLRDAGRAEAHDPARAEALYRAVIEQDPANAQAIVNLGRLRHCDGDAAEAARLYERATEVGAQAVLTTAWFNLGVAREDIGDAAGALEAYRRALALDPSSADAHYNAARLCERTGDQLGALRHLRSYRKYAGDPS
jgi:tetratricopeptide (TPR) repeat protein